LNNPPVPLPLNNGPAPLAPNNLPAPPIATVYDLKSPPDDYISVFFYSGYELFSPYTFPVVGLRSIFSFFVYLG